MKIGIGVTTRDRYELLNRTLSKIVELMPPNTKLIVVDDASVPGLVTSTFRFEKQAGVARAKNKCLELLQDCDHIFLFDDDCYPINKEWYLPYINHKEPHLMYQFKLPGKPASDMKELYRDDKTVAYSHTRGAMIYLERRVLDVVGGFDTEYDNGYEHPDLSNRIFNAGLTSHRAMDVPNSDKLLYCLDQDGKVDSTIKPDKKRDLKNFRYYSANKGSGAYKEFRS